MKYSSKKRFFLLIVLIVLLGLTTVLPAEENSLDHLMGIVQPGNRGLLPEIRYVLFSTITALSVEILPEVRRKGNGLSAAGTATSVTCPYWLALNFPGNGKRKRKLMKIQ